MNVFAIIPAYNESKRIASTIGAIASRQEVQAIVVVDDGSTDGTQEVARAAGATEVIRLTKNSGKGAALTEGYRAVRDRADIILLLDADLGSSAAECIKLLAPLLRGEADMSIGMLPSDREMDTAGSLGGGMGIVVRLARWGLSKQAGVQLQQPLSGQRAITKDLMESIGGKFQSGFGAEVGLTLAASRSGGRIVEVPTFFRHRVTENDWHSILHRGRQLLDVAQVLFAR